MKINTLFLLLFLLLQGTVAFCQTYIYENLEKENVSGYSKIVTRYFYAPFKDYKYTHYLKAGKIIKTIQHIRLEKQSVVTRVYDDTGKHLHNIQSYDRRRGGNITDTLPMSLDEGNSTNLVYNENKQLKRRSSSIYDEESKTGWCIDYTYNNDGLLSEEYSVAFRKGIRETEKTTYVYDTYGNITEITREARPEKNYPIRMSLGTQYRYEKFEYEYAGNIWVKKYWSSESKPRQLLVSRTIHK